jgi:hypothetical protein
MNDIKGISMDDRLARVEHDVSVLKADVSVLKADVNILKGDVQELKVKMGFLASKEDLHKELHLLTWRLLGAMAVVVSLVYGIARYVN